MREAMYYLASTMHVNHAHRMRGHRWSDNAAAQVSMAAKVQENMAGCCAHVETCLEGALPDLGNSLSVLPILISSPSAPGCPPTGSTSPPIPNLPHTTAPCGRDPRFRPLQDIGLITEFAT